MSKKDATWKEFLELKKPFESELRDIVQKENEYSELAARALLEQNPSNWGLVYIIQLVESLREEA